MPNFCSNCGTKLDPNAKFCSNCGSAVSGVVAPAPAPVQNNASVTTDTEEVQTELYSLYKILEPVSALDMARRKVDAKIAELRGHQLEISARFRMDFVYYAPFISSYFQESFISPTNKEDIKSWKAFVKRHADYKSDPIDQGKYDLQDIYRLFKQNQSKVLKDLGVSFLYYKMGYCLEEPQTPSKYLDAFVCDKHSKSSISNYKLINYGNFINSYLQKKLGDKCDDYLMSMLLDYSNTLGNRGELQLHDITMGYAYAANLESKNLRYFDKSLGFPEIQYTEKRPFNMWEVANAAKSRLERTAPIKKELDGTLAELRKLKGKIDGAIAEYMKDVDRYIEKNIKIIPFSYAHNWESVAYFLHLIVNRRGRDIYEIINQYEIDMKHRELTSALVDIRSEISKQTQILGSRLDAVNRSVVQMTDKITSAIYDQTEALGTCLQNINYSVISTGASVVGAISKLGKAMGQAMNNMQFRVTIS
ncbi:MAG: zinc ribbon domain-containing protein [Clostridia bacterium]|nr:zinc ribbon domain-containing protein [Clostridia bacterium]